MATKFFSQKVKFQDVWYLSAIEIIISIPRLHDEDVSTIATHRPTKTVLQKEPYLQNKKEKVVRKSNHKKIKPYLNTSQNQNVYKKNRLQKKVVK